MHESAVVPRVDLRIELTSILSRLAEYGEYNNDQFRPYAEAVDRHFKPYKDHPAVAFARDVRQRRGIGFDAVPSLAVHLNPPPSLAPAVDLGRGALDARWGNEDALRYATLLKAFYEDTDAAGFFRAHTALYRGAEGRFQSVLDAVRLDWYEHFYGERPEGTFNLVLGLLNGPGNFGPRVVHPDGREDLYAILGTGAPDASGLPVYDDNYLPLIIHEFNHSFVNKLVERHFARFEPSGEALQHGFVDEMRRQGYAGGRTLVIESLVRACVVRYLRENPWKVTAAVQLGEEVSRGFVWTGALVACLDRYERDRRRYPTLASYIEPIARCFDTLPSQIERLKRERARNQPRIVRVLPFPNQASQVDPGVREVRIVFDRKMMPRVGLYTLDAKDPFVARPTFARDGRTLVGQVRLAPNETYGVGLMRSAFRSVGGYSLAEDYPLTFTTRG